MTIWRGPGGTGTASSEVDTTEYQEFLVQAQAAKVAAEAARDAALAAETNAELAETNAEAAEASAIAAGNAAQDWATKTSGPVAGGEYSAKYNAQLAAASAAASEAALDAYEDRYLGAKTADPTVDNDGNALVAGTQYFNTVSDEIKVYNGTSWQSAAVVGGTVTDLTVTNTIVGSITGNAGTVTNGVVTTGSYANPSWLTSLAWSKVTSTPTTVAGYGIANAYTKTEVDTADALKLNAANPSYTGTLTGGTGVVNLGSGQFYKDASGNVGIGTSSPNNKLAVMSAAATTGITLATNGNYTNAAYVTNDTTYIKLGSTAGSTGDKFRVALAAPDNAATIDSGGNLLVGATGGGTDYKIRAERSDNFGLAAFRNNATSGVTYDQTQVIVGQSASTAYHFARYYASAGASAQFAFRGDGQLFATATSIASISDARTKENVRDSVDGLDTVLGLRTVRFDFKEGFSNNRKNQLGFIAQEMEQVFPDAVDVSGQLAEDGSEYKTVAPGTLIPVLVKAIQEQQAIITALAARVEALEAK